MSGRAIAILLGHAWARHRMPLIPIAIAIALFQYLLTQFAPAPNEVNWMAAVIQALPPELRKLIEDDLALSSEGFIALGFAHPFVLLLLSAWVARTSSAGIAGEVGRGTMDLLAPRPVRRWHFVAAGMLTVALGLALIVTCGLVATIAGARSRGIPLPAGGFASIALAAWLLFSAWGAVGLFVSSASRDAGRAIGWTTGIIAASFVLNYVARLWKTVAALRPLSLFYYYWPQSVLTEGIRVSAWAVFAATIIAGLIASLVAVQRRDL